MSNETAKLNRGVAILAAGIASFGVHASFDHSSGVLTITGLTASGVLAGAWHWLNSYAVQHTIYRISINQEK